MSRRTKADRKRARANQAMFDAAVAISCPRRERNGRLSRRKVEVQARAEQSETDAKETMLNARLRHFPKIALIDEMDPGKPNVGTIHGRMCLLNAITLDQWRAAEWYLEKRAAWARAVEVPGEVLDRKDRGKFDEEGHEAFCKGARAQWAEITRCLQDASIQSRSPIIAAMDHILVRQSDLEHLVGDLRLGLNCVGKLMRGK